MHTSNSDRHTEPIDDPLGLRRSAEKSANSFIDLVEGHVHSVNPLWMITGGLAAFILLLALVW